MATAEITVQYCNPRKEGKKNASVKTVDGKLYLVPPELFPSFKEGGRYNIEYKTSSMRGVDFHFVEKVEPAAAAPAASSAAKYQAGKYGTVDMETAERIFVAGWMNGVARNQNIDPRGMSADDLTAEVNKLRSVWGATFGNPQKSSELNDEIPW